MVKTTKSREHLLKAVDYFFTVEHINGNNTSKISKRADVF